ncbi:MAG: UDP-N-acetylmuramate--L-alanine ligase [Phycisphaerales bacterium JB043]
MPPTLRGARVHCLGIGGCGLSGLAQLIRARGAIVSGSDMQSSEVLDTLRHGGMDVREESPGTLPSDADLLVISAAVRENHPQVVEARSRSIPVRTYAQMLGWCMRRSTGVAIAGTHGKSTTSAMLGVALAHAGLDPTVIVGAQCRQLTEGVEHPTGGFCLGSDRIERGAREGEPGVLIAEACEFNRSFHNLCPTQASIASIEADHLDIYGSLDAVVEAFGEFARLLPSADRGGRLLIAHEGAHRREVTAGLECAIETVGFAPGSDWRVRYDSASHRVGLSHDEIGELSWTMRQPGEHNAMNSAYAAAHALRLGADASLVCESLSDFKGVARRTEFLGEHDGVRVYDDYGHHPTEIEATLRALREHERPHERGGRLICVFQPHQHSRTRFLLDEFAQSFTQADVVIVPHIYFVRDSEAERTLVSASDLVDRLRERGVQAMHLYPFEAIIEQLSQICREGDLVVVMGAGPVWQVAHGFMRNVPSPDGSSVGMVAS